MTDVIRLKEGFGSLGRSWRQMPVIASLGDQLARRATACDPAANSEHRSPTEAEASETHMRLDCSGALIAASANAIDGLRCLGIVAEVGNPLRWLQDDLPMDLRLPMMRSRSDGPQPVVIRGPVPGVLVGMLEKQADGYLMRFPASLPTEQFRELLCQQFQLTPPQCDVALALAAGVSLGDVALQRESSINTIRTHVNAIFVKLGVRRQGELVSLLQQLRGLLGTSMKR